MSEAPDGALDLRDVFVITEIEAARQPDADEEDEVGVAPSEDNPEVGARAPGTACCFPRAWLGPPPRRGRLHPAIISRVPRPLHACAGPRGAHAGAA